MKRTISALLAVLLLIGCLPVFGTALAAGENTDYASALPLVPGENSVTLPESGKTYYYSFTVPTPGQFVTVKAGSVYGFYTADKTWLGSYSQNGTSLIIAPQAGTYYVQLRQNNSVNDTVTLAFPENDAFEPNDTRDAAVDISNGVARRFVLDSAYRDKDWVKVWVPEDGMDIALYIEGYNYASKERVRVEFDKPDSGSRIYAYAESMSPLCFHAAEAGWHTFTLSYDSSGGSSQSLTFERIVRAEILEGDGNEPNDRKEDAKMLHLGTDETFSVGGYGDEDWFTFEAAGESEFYTLTFLDLNTDYSDKFSYEVYGPDGSTVQGKTPVNIRHTAVLSCPVEGIYSVRITENMTSSVYSPENRFTRSTLRIRVDAGGDDPFESNDVWTSASEILPDQTVPHVLSNTTDSDWFMFTVPEDDMAVRFDFSSKLYWEIYTADEAYLGQHTSMRGYGYTRLNAKLQKAGAYYIRLYAGSTSYVSSGVRTFSYTLKGHTDSENNDTWKKAVRIWPDVPQTFSLAAENDEDWFLLTVPENAGTLNAAVLGTYGYASLYRRDDFFTIGDGAPRVYSNSLSKYGTVFQVPALTPGEYCLRIYDDNYSFNTVYSDSASLRFFFTDAHYSIETAKGSEAGKWYELGQGYNYLNAGTLTAGSTLRAEYQGSYNADIYLYDGNGNKVGNCDATTFTFLIPSDGQYYLSFQGHISIDAEGNVIIPRARYFVGTEGSITDIEAPEEITLAVGERVYPDIYCLPVDAKSYDSYQTISWSSTDYDYSIGRYYTGGYILGIAPGEFYLNISARDTNYNTIKKSIHVTVVSEYPEAEAMELTSYPTSMELGETAIVETTTTPDKCALVFESSDESVIRVLGNGKLAAVGAGEATVTVSSGGCSQSFTVTVTGESGGSESVTSLKLDRYSMTVYCGEDPAFLTATAEPAIDIVWTSGNQSVATVTSAGGVQGVAPGVAVISATAGDHRVSCVVTVLAKRVRVTGVSFDESEHELPLLGTVTVPAAVSPDDATTKNLLWTSSDISVAMVSRTGIVTALAVGEATITATTEDGGFSASILIKVTAAPSRGDLNGDGYIDAADALMCLRFAVGLIELTDTQLRSGDLNNDGEVDAGDAIKILRYDAWLIDIL